MSSKNTETASNGVDVYTTMLYLLADEYIETRLDGKEEGVMPNGKGKGQP